MQPESKYRIAKALLVEFLFLVGLYVSSLPANGAAPPSFEKAWNLIATYDGASDALLEADSIGLRLKYEHPSSGYYEVLRAYELATWDRGREGSLAYGRAMGLVNEALTLNPSLAQGYAVRARLFLRTSSLGEALRDAEKALQLEPKSADAMIVRADIARAAKDRTAAEQWYLQFIDVAPNGTRKSNGYAYLAQTYVDASYYQGPERPAFIAKATAAFEAMVRLDPTPRKMVNYSGFLNNEAGNFDAAERYARTALSLEEISAARHNLALAQYQKLTLRLSAMSDQALLDAVSKISASTWMSIEEVARSRWTGGAAVERLQPLRTRLAGTGVYRPATP